MPFLKTALPLVLLGLRSTLRAPLTWALAAAVAGLAWLAPDLAAFAFSDESRLAQSGVLGTVLLLPLGVGMANGLAFRWEPGHHPGLRGLLTDSAPAGLVVPGLAVGISFGACIPTLMCLVVGTFSLSTRGLPVPPATPMALAVAVAWTIAGSSLGLLSATLASPTLAWVLGLLPVLALATAPLVDLPLPIPLPAADVLLPARDAAHGDVTAAAALLSMLAALLMTSALGTLGLAALRARELAPPPGDR